MDKLKMSSVNKINENIEKIGKLFPNCLTERVNKNGSMEFAIDFDMLKQELCDTIVEGSEERYQFTWPDKKKSVMLSNAPIAKTLRPRKEESVNFDTTENLYIEGDNLDVLKILQETYLNKIKMIYIDPPYNTGNDFIYKDNFSKNSQDYLQNSGQFDEDGNRLFKNMETNGRFHTDWLNMIYPRLKLAKDLLKDDGVIFISIDDNEQANLKKICDEIFGESNFVAGFIRQTRQGGGSMSKYVSTDHDYCLMYSKNKSFLNKLIQPYSGTYLKRYSEEDENGKYFWDTFARNRQGSSNIYSIRCPNGEEIENAWIYKKEKFLQLLDLGEIRFKKNGNSYSIQIKQRIGCGSIVRSLLLNFPNELGTSCIKSIFKENEIFSYVKPIELIKDLIQISTNPNDIILDFFSGSATTAHAVMQLNAENLKNEVNLAQNNMVNSNFSSTPPPPDSETLNALQTNKFKFILVQLPELVDEKSEAYKNGFKNICEIGKERIRRAGSKIKEDNKNIEGILNLDIGFRVLKLDSTNMKDVYYSPNDTRQKELLNLIDNVKEGRTSLDLLFQVMLDLGILLSSKIATILIDNKLVFNVENNFLIACFDENITEETIKAIAKKKPHYFVLKDSCISNDNLALNFDQIFQALSPDTIKKVL